MNTKLTRFNKSPVRWFIVGSLTFLIDTSIFIVAFYITNHAIGSNLLSGLIATTFNYFSHYHWSFASDRKHHQSTAIYIFFFFTFLATGTSIINFLIERNVLPIVAKVGTAAIIAPISFFIMKFVTFRKNGDA